MVSVSEFIREYTRALVEGYAAVFAGAGLSRASGFVNWKELIEPLARDIGLDIEKEHDLVAIAQYYKNERSGRAGINQRILNEFTQNVEINDNIKIRNFVHKFQKIFKHHCFIFSMNLNLLKLVRRHWPISANIC